MTPVTPPSSSKTSARKKVREPNGSEDDWQPDTEEAAAASDEEHEQDEPDDGECSSANKKRKTKAAAPSTPKSKAKSTGSKGGKAAAGAWTEDEILALYKATHLIALQNIPTISEQPGLEDRGKGPLNMKMRSEFKKTEKALGGDGKWIDDFKLLPSKKLS